MSLDPLGGDALWSFDGVSQSSVPDQTGENTESARDTEENGVVLVLVESVVLKENTTVGINVGPWVLGLSVLGKDWWGDFVDLRDELEEWIVGQVLKSELTLACVTRIGLSEHGMSESRDDLARVEGIPQSLLYDFERDVTVSELLLECQSPAEDFLVGKSVKGTSETVHSRSKGKIRIRESATDEVSGVGADVATFVIAVDDQVEAHQFVEVLVVETEHAVEVGGPIVVNLTFESSVLVGVSVDSSGDLRETSDEVK